MNDLTCREVADSAPGFALDILEPTARARVAAHLIRCAGCRETVTDMQDSADRLLDVGSEWAGSESARSDWEHEYNWVDEGEPAPLRPGRRRFRVALTVAAAAFLLVGTTFGPEIEQLTSTPEKPVASAVLMSGQQAVGVVRFYAGQSPAIDIQVDRIAASGRLSVVLISRDGTARKVGELQLGHGEAAWLGPDPVARAELTGLVLVDSGHHQVAAAAVP